VGMTRARLSGARLTGATGAGSVIHAAAGVESGAVVCTSIGKYDNSIARYGLLDMANWG
jgi:hypothetical protein